MDEGVK